MNNIQIQDRVRSILRRSDITVSGEITAILSDISGYTGLGEYTADIIVDSTGYAALPDGLVNLVSVRYGDIALSPVSLPQLLHCSDSGGDIEYYALWGGNIYVAPKPVISETFSLFYKGYSTNVSQLSDKWLEALVNGVCWKAAVRLNLDANRQLLYRDYYMAELERRKNEMPVNPTFINYTELQ